MCSWDGNNKIGAGSATIIESKPGELVRQRMDWKRPMEGTSTVEFTFKPQGDKTVVTWAIGVISSRRLPGMNAGAWEVAKASSLARRSRSGRSMSNSPFR